ncbi:hypothetical protein Tco_1505207 [Tanacetum coccineum]
MVDSHLGTRLDDSIQEAFMSNTAEFEKKSQAERKRYIICENLRPVNINEPQKKTPLAGSNQGLKRRKTSKDAEPSKGSKSKESKSSSSKGTKYQSKSSGKSVQAEESMFETADMEMPQNQRGGLGNTDDQPNIEAASKHDWFKKLKRHPTPDPDWNTNKSIIFRPPHTWISKIAKAEIPPLTFDKRMSTPIDFSAYGHAKAEWNSNIILKNVINLSPIDLTGLTMKDAGLLLSYQKKLSNLERDVIFDLNMALRMFTRRVFILKRVEEIQLGVDSYQKKLNITKPETFRFDISNMTPYTAYNNPQGIIYLDKLKRNRLMRSNELYKFCDGTLTSVRTVLHDIASSLRMDYLPKRRWSKLDKRRSCIMIKAVN